MADIEAAATNALEDVARNGVTDREVVKARNQLRARLVFENDSVTNLGHQLGYFETVREPGDLSERTGPHCRCLAG